jgi:Cu/Ag efflux pump CusA
VALLALPFVVLGSRRLEIVHPMAVVLLGGVVSVALMSLFVLPALTRARGRPGAPGRARSGGSCRRWSPR